MKKGKITIRHAVPGRLRFNVCGIRHAYERSALLEKWLAQQSGVREVD